MKNNNPFEKEIKTTILNYLMKKNKLDGNVTIINELTIDSFSRRVDLVSVIDNKIIAYEIKSDADNLYRLPGQLEKYRKYFDKTIVVATPKHINKILSSVNDSMEVWEVSGQKITIKKRGRASRVENKLDYLDLLRVQDMHKLSKKLKIKTTIKNKVEIKKTLTANIHNISHEKLKHFVIDNISQRYKLTSNVFLKKIKKENQVTVSDLALLSPYHKIKSQNTIIQGSMLDQLN